MLRAPYAGNRLAEIVCKSAQQQGPDCPVVGFFHLGTLTRIDPSREEDKRDEEFCQKLASRHQYLKKKAQNQETGGGAELGPEPEDPYEALDECYKQGQPGLPIKECWDAQRVMVYDSVLHPNATAGSVKEVGTTIDVSCQPTMVEELLAKARAAGDRFPNSSKDYHIAMLDKVTHAVVFADQDFPGKKKAKGEEEGQIVPNVTQGCDTQNNFADMLQDQLPTGVIAAGGTRPLFDSCVECLKAGRPIFCFRGTGGSSSTIAKLIDFGKLKKGQPAGAGLQSRPPAGKKKLEEFIAREFSPDAPVTGDARDFGPTVQRNILRDARALACNFPEHFNPASALVIEVGAPEGKEFELTKFSPEAGDSVDILQDQITKVMASVYDNVPELGGVEADARSVRHALALQSHLKRGAARYRREGSLIITIMRILGVATSVAAALRSDPQYQGGVADSDWLHWVSMALPLMLAVSASVLTTYRPIQKFAALSSAAHEIESEIYRFRTRTRPYYATKSTASGKGHRQLFSSTCDRILATHMTGDASLSAERLVDADRWLALTPDANNNVSTKSLAPVAPAAEKGRKGKLGTPSDGAGVALAAGDGPEVEMPTVTQAGSANEQQQQQQQPKKSETSTLAADEYTIERALPELKKAQRAAPRISRQLKALQLLVIIGAAVRSALPDACMHCSSFAHPTPLPTAGDGDSAVRGTRVDACSLDGCRHDRVRDLLPTARVDPARGQCDGARDHPGARLVGRALSHPAADAEFQGSAGRHRGERIGDAARGLRAGRDLKSGQGHAGWRRERSRWREGSGGDAEGMICFVMPDPISGCGAIDSRRGPLFGCIGYQNSEFR
eukprot:Transcript_4692.p1 GENE.Transcript_4692~~Transcript_4692.p1  ORF type:complete len:869 (-),score=149.70 Transcript_4692:527-3061(-)